MSAQRERIKYQDYLQLPEDSRCELHQRVLARLYQAVSAHIEQQGLGRVYFAPVDVILDEDSVVQPDLQLVTGASNGGCTGATGPASIRWSIRRNARSRSLPCVMGACRPGASFQQTRGCSPCFCLASKSRWTVCLPSSLEEKIAARGPLAGSRAVGFFRGAQLIATSASPWCSRRNSPRGGISYPFTS